MEIQKLPEALGAAVNFRWSHSSSIRYLLILKP